MKSIDVSLLLLHGEDDRIVPFADAGMLLVKLLKHGAPKSYPGLPHGMCTTNPELINADLLAFFRS